MTKMKKPRRVIPDLCRICLTGSSSMLNLDDLFDQSDDEKITISRAIEIVMSSELVLFDSAPKHICSMCLSLLKISYNLRLQFEKTQVELQDKYIDCNKEQNCSVGKIFIVDDEESQEDITQILQSLKNGMKIQVKNNSSTDSQMDTENCDEGDYETIIVKIEDDSSLNRYLRKTKEDQEHSIQDHSLSEQYEVHSSLNTVEKVEVSNSEDTYLDEQNRENLDDDNTTESNNPESHRPTCFKCGLLFSSHFNLRRHERITHHGENGSISNLQNKRRQSVMRAKLMKRAQRRGGYVQICQICGHMSKSQGGAKYHSLTHKEKRFACDQCPKKYFTFSHLKYHQQHIHGPEGTLHLCQLCGQYRNSVAALAYHMKLHQKIEKKFSCHLCGLKFLVKNALNTHLRRHNGDRRYKCDMCKGSFFSTNELSKHRMTHTGERPHKCPHCEKAFVTKFNKRSHMMTHEGPFMCTQCKRGFIDLNVLNIHLRMKHHINARTDFEEVAAVVDDSNDLTRQCFLEGEDSNCFSEDLSGMEAASFEWESTT